MKYMVGIGVIKKTRTKIVNISTALILLATGLGGGLPALLSGTAHAAGNTVVQPYSLQGWNYQNVGGGTTGFILDSSAPLGKSALRLTTDNNNASKAALSINTATKLSSLTQLSYSTKQISASFAGGDPAYRLTIDADGNPATTTDTATLVYEPYWQDALHGGDPAPVQTGAWQNWNVANGVFWASIPGGNSISGLTNGAGGPPFYTLGQLKTLLPNAEVTAVSTGIGSYNLNYNVEVDNFNFNGNVYDFAAAPAAAQTNQVVTPSELNFPNGWYYFNDNNDTPSTTATSDANIVPNPVPASGDNAAIMLNASNGLRSAVSTLQYSGTPLSSIAALGFSTYQPNTNQGSTNESAFLNFDVDFGTGLSGYQGRLVYVPSQNGSVKQNTWQNWETVASNGQWTWSHYYSSGNKWPDGNTSEYRSWDDIVASFPQAKISGEYGPGQLLVRVGNPDNYNFIGYTDHIYLATTQNGHNIHYNFELVPPAAPTPTGFTQSGNKTLACGAFANGDGIYSTHLNWTLPQGETESAWRVTPTYPSGSHGTPYSWTSGTSVWVGANIGQGYGAAPHDQGTYSYAIQYKGSNGLWSEPATCNLIYDSTAPVVTIKTPTDNTNSSKAVYVSNNSAITISGTATDTGAGVAGQTMTVGVTDTTDSNKVLVSTHTIIQPDGSWSIAVPAGTLPDGHHMTISAATRDKSAPVYGNVGSAHAYFIVDNTAPSVPQLVSPVDRGYTKTNDFYFDWNDSTDANPGITYEFQSSMNPHTTNGVLDTNVWHSPILNSSTIHSVGAPDGVWYWQVRAIDAAGNKSAWTSVWHVTIDTHLPATTLNVENLTNGYVNTRQHGNMLTVTGHASDGLGLNRVLVQLLTSKHGAIENHTVYLSGTTDDWSTDFDISKLGLHDGQYSVVAAVDDNAGNVYKTPYLDFTLDNTKPVASFTSTTDNPSPNGHYNSDFQVGYEVSDNFKLANVGVALFDTDSTHTNHWAAGCYSNANETGNDDKGTCTIKLGNLPDGKYYVAVQGQDAAGLWTVAATRTIYIDRTAPSVPTVLTPADKTATNDANVTFSWDASTDTVSSSADLTYQGEGSTDPSTNADGSFVNGSPLISTAPGQTSDTLSITPDGTYYWHMRACDQAGNCSAWTTTQQFTVDTVAPALTIDPSSGIDTTPTITGTTSDATDQVTVDGNAATVSPIANTNGTYDWSYTPITPFSLGSTTITVVSTDQAGNATQETANVTVNAVPGPHLLGAAINNNGANGNGNSHVTITPNNDGHVLGDSTTTPNTTTNNGSGNGDNGNVKGDSTVNNKSDTTKSSNFLGLGWWWLLILAAIVAFLWAVLRRSNSNESQA